MIRDAEKNRAMRNLRHIEGKRLNRILEETVRVPLMIRLLDTYHFQLVQLFSEMLFLQRQMQKGQNAFSHSKVLDDITDFINMDDLNVSFWSHHRMPEPVT